MILSHPDAPEGSVLHLSSYSPSDFTLPCAILCRNTAPLVSFAYSLLRRDVPCRVLGREIGAQLVAIVKKLRATDLKQLIDRLGEWKSRELSRCEATNTSPERIFDQYECISFFVQDLDSDSQRPSDLIAKIELLFEEVKPGDNPAHVLLSTIHKAKGLEWPKVFILDFTKYQPSKFATSPWQKRQEKNLIYVAITRAMKTLVYINSNQWKS